MVFWWQQLISTLVFIVGTFASVFAGIHLARKKAQFLPEHRIIAVEQLASTAAKSVSLPNPAIESNLQLADVALIELLEEYDVRIPSKKAREHALSAAFFTLKSNG